MKLIYIHQYFVTNEGTSGTRSYDVAKYLVQMGHQVTVITGLHDQDLRVRLPWWRFFKTVEIDGIKVIYCNSRYSNNLSVPGRLYSWMSFAKLATWAALRERGADLIFATSTPLTVGIPGRVAAALKSLPYVFEVRDLWPEDLLAADRIKPGLQFKLWEMLERFCYAKARKILLVSRGFHDRLIERGFDPARLQTIVLGADGSLFADAKPDTAYFREHGLEGKTVAVYTGAHGDANGLSQILDAAEHLKHRTDIAIVLIGEGKMRQRLMADASARGLTNVRFLPAVPKHRLPNILTACHIGLMILKQITRPRWVTPNKIFDYMFAGLPSIVNFPGTTADLVVEEGVGVAAIPGDARNLAARIEHWVDHPAERAAIGQKARDVAWKKFDRKSIAKSLADVFESCR